MILAILLHSFAFSVLILIQQKRQPFQTSLIEKKISAFLPLTKKHECHVRGVSKVGRQKKWNKKVYYDAKFFQSQSWFLLQYAFSTNILMIFCKQRFKIFSHQKLYFLRIFKSTLTLKSFYCLFERLNESARKREREKETQLWGTEDYLLCYSPNICNS